MQIKDAVVKGYQLVLRSAMPYAQASRSMGPGERAFEEATKYLVGSMLDSIQKKLEIEAIYGQLEYGLANAVAVGLVITIKSSEFAPGIWSGAVGMPIEIYDPTLTTLRGGASATVASVKPGGNSEGRAGAHTVFFPKNKSLPRMTRSSFRLHMLAS